MSVLRRVLELGVSPGESREERDTRRLQTAMALASVPLVGSWGLTFVVTGHPQAAFWHLGYCLVTVLLLTVLALTHDVRWFRAPHILAVMAAPFGLQWQLGSFVNSGGALFWCLLAPIAAMMFLGLKRSLFWFALMLALVGLSAWHDGTPSAIVLTPAQVSFEFALNVAGLTAFLFLSTRHFVARIDQEKQRANRLLENVLPTAIAERLKREEGTIAERYEVVTVLFSDIVGFTSMSTTMPAAALVKMLDEIFSGFDAIADRHGLEKIKTIGDAYMLVGGLPIPCDDHAERVVRAALAMDEFLGHFSRERGLPLAMRIGIHSGEVVAGVIGRRKFAYDLWGDTVNTASRMESHGAAGRIHISASTRALLDGRFDCVARGLIPVKGKGEMQTFWLDPIARAA